MGWEGWFVAAIVTGMFIGLTRNYAPDALLLGALTLVGLAGIVSSSELFEGFSNKGMLTVGALYVVAAGLRETGALNSLGAWIFGRAKTERAALGRMAISVTAMSAFLNNTPIVAMFIPIITSWCQKNRVAPSRLLLPLSYLCIFGGTCTLIGTSTNLVVNGLMATEAARLPELAQALRPMRFFELGYVGLPYAIIGTAYLFIAGPKLLPSRKGFMEQVQDSIREYLVDLKIPAGNGLHGKTVESAGLRHLPGLFLVEIRRGDQVIAPPKPDQLLLSGDTLTFTGLVTTIVDLKHQFGLVPVADGGYVADAAEQRGRRLCEAVVSHTSPLIGKTIRDNDFRALYNAAVVAVHRGGERLTGRVGDIVVHPGDTMLLQAGPHFVRAHQNNPDFLLVSGIENGRPVRRDKALLSMGLLAALVAMMASGHIPIVLAAFLVAGAMIITRCISVANARQSVDLQTLLTICAAFGLGTALVNAGVVEAVAGMVAKTVGAWGPYAVLMAVYVLTSMFTEVVTNNAAAALMFPFAVAFGQQIGASPRPFVMAVAFAASASFMTPLGYQTNLMVFGPGGYRFSDFVRLGLPLNLLLMLVATILIPLVWPF